MINVRGKKKNYLKKPIEKKKNLFYPFTLEKRGSEKKKKGKGKRKRRSKET